MVNFVSLIAADTDAARPDWIVNSFPIIKIVLASLILVCSIVMIVIVLCQKTEADGTNVITGKADTFYNRNKGGSLQGKIKKLTIALSIMLVVFCMAFFILNAIYAGNV